MSLTWPTAPCHELCSSDRQGPLLGLVPVGLRVPSGQLPRPEQPGGWVSVAQMVDVWGFSCWLSTLAHVLPVPGSCPLLSECVFSLSKLCLLEPAGCLSLRVLALQRFAGFVHSSWPPTRCMCPLPAVLPGLWSGVCGQHGGGLHPLPSLSFPSSTYNLPF